MQRDACWVFLWWRIQLLPLVLVLINSSLSAHMGDVAAGNAVNCAACWGRTEVLFLTGEQVSGENGSLALEKASKDDPSLLQVVDPAEAVLL